MFSSGSFMVSGLKFKSLTHFELVFVHGVWWLSSFPSAIYRKDRPFPIIYSWLLCRELVTHVWVCFWALYSVLLIDVSFYANTILFWLLQLCNIL